MIKKLENGSTLITLGEGTVYTGNVYVGDSNVASGIYFTNTKGKSDDAVIMQITTEKAVASYLMSLLRLLETWVDDKESDLFKVIDGFKEQLNPLLPEGRDSDE